MTDENFECIQAPIGPHYYIHQQLSPFFMVCTIHTTHTIFVLGTHSFIWSFLVFSLFHFPFSFSWILYTFLSPSPSSIPFVLPSSSSRPLSIALPPLLNPSNVLGHDYFVSTFCVFHNLHTSYMYMVTYVSLKGSWKVVPLVKLLVGVCGEYGSRCWRDKC